MKKLSLEDENNSRQVNNWVDPSFSEPSRNKFLSSERECKQISGPKSERKKSKKRKEEGNGVLWMIERDQDHPWIDKYSPHSQGELAVHKKKIDEVEKWITAHTNEAKGGILILTGPSGCGKTATVQVLSLQMGIRVQEWSNPSSVERYMGDSSEWKSKDFSCNSQLAQFQEFLLRVNKYKCLKIKGEREAGEKRLILVEDFPNQFYRQPYSFHDVLRIFVKSSRCPLVFVVSDSQSGEGSLRSLFPKEIQEELHINCISFNPVAPTTMTKVLKSILYMEAEKTHKTLYVPDKKELEMICSGTSGDIRSAINSLQFCCLPGPDKGLCALKKPTALSFERGVTLSKQKGIRKSKTKEQEENQAIGGKDVSFFLFRAVGKILHCKRGNCEGTTENKVAPVPGLPFHLLQQQVLLVQPELVVERSQTSGEFFSLCLHQNYLDFFSHIEDVERASKYLSDADLLTGNWTIRHIIGDYGSSVATRGLIHSNSCQLPVGFRPLHKPSWCQVSKKHQDNCLAAQSLFRSYRLTAVNLQTQLIPFLAKLPNPTWSQAQMAVVQDVGQMSLICPGRLKLENLRDKEMGQEIEEEEEVHCRTDKGLHFTQAQLTMNQALLEEENLIIQEYESD